MSLVLAHYGASVQKWQRLDSAARPARATSRSILFSPPRHVLRSHSAFPGRAGRTTAQRQALPGRDSGGGARAPGRGGLPPLVDRGGGASAAGADCGRRGPPGRAATVHQEGQGWTERQGIGTCI